MIFPTIATLAAAIIIANFADWQFSGREGRLMRLRSGQNTFNLAYIFPIVLSVLSLFNIISFNVYGAVLSVVVGVNHIAIILERHRAPSSR